VMSPSDDTGTDDATSLALTTVSDLYSEGHAALSAAGINNARRETLWILESALGVPSLKIQTEWRRPVSSHERERARLLLSRRAAREPLQYLLGTQEFCGLEFRVDPGVLIPRPETELLVREIVSHESPAWPPVIADVGTGSGCVAVAVARALPAASLYATDQSPVALRIARHNAHCHQVSDRISFLHGDLLRPLAELGLTRQLTAAVSNPPYIAEADFPDLMPEVGRFEPRLALVGGEDGLAVHRRLLTEAPAFLMKGGLLALEVGQGQAARLRALADAHGGYCHVHTVQDQAGIERVLCFRKR